MNENLDQQEALFEQALQCPSPEARAEFLDRACRDKPELRARLELLLEGHFKGQSFLAGAEETRRLPAEEPIGAMIGRYKLLEQIGEGGCGLVYVADQEEPVRRRVALKVIKLGMDTKQVIARFEAERQALALMDHPNIAHVLDAGATETGRPYFVMELVRGIKFTDYCERHKLAIGERLQLFISVCHAIQHAHQKGIIHRDIKPSNILVTLHDSIPVPKVIDFGIAKATQGRLTDNTIYTAFEQFIGTPAYMSPEQAEMSGLDIDTRSDIYSLGVLLYELLTGRTPFDQKELLAAGLDEMRRTIREKEPPKPSTRLTQDRASELQGGDRSADAEASQRIHLVRGDLDWIVMKCLAKDRTRRYETANGLARDLERHLKHEPVAARPPSRVYEFQRAVRRHWMGFAATTTVIVALTAGIIVSTREMFRAERAEREQIRLRKQAEANERFFEVESHFLRGDMKYAEPNFYKLPAAVVEHNSERAIRMLEGIGDWHVRRDQYQAAISNFTSALRLNPADYTIYFALIPLYAQIKDIPNYRRICHDAAVQFKGTTNPFTADQIAKVSLLLPEAGIDMDVISEWANTVIELGNTKPDLAKFIPAFQNTKAFAEYRLGRFQSAVEWEQRSISNTKVHDWVYVQTHLISAMAYSRLNRSDEAGRELTAARRILDKEGPTVARAVFYQLSSVAWVDFLATRLLMAEADTVVKSNSSAATVNK